MNQQNTEWIRQERGIPERVLYAHSIHRGALLFEQVAELVKAINSLYVQRKQGKMTYLAQHQARAEMNRIFGYGNWDAIEGDPILVYEEEKQSNGTKWIACYKMTVTVNVRDLWGMPVCTVTGTHVEANANLPDRSEAHAMAVTSVSSYALRRALINLGDRFGLGLYNGGSMEPHGQYTIQLEPGVLFDWVPATADSTSAAIEAPAQPSHETIQAQPVISDDGVDPNWVDPDQQQTVNEQVAVSAATAQAAQQPAQQPSYAPNPSLSPQGQQQMQEFHQVQEQLQEDRQQARQQPQQGYFEGAQPQNWQQQQQQQQQPQYSQPPQQQYVPQQQQGYDPSLIAQMQQNLKVDQQEGQQPNG